MKYKARKIKQSISKPERVIFGVCMAVFSISSLLLYTHPVLATGQGSLVGYWKLDETSTGSTVADASGYGNILDVSGSPQPSTNVPAISFPDARSLSFNGTSDTLDMASPSGFSYGTNPRSISSWVYLTSMPPSGTVEVPVAYGSCAYNSNPNNTGKAFGYYIDSSNDIHFWGCGSYDFNTNTAVTLNTWSNIVISYDGTTVTVYLNGNKIASQADTLVSQGSSTPEMDIGSAYQIDSTAHYFSGNIDDVRVYNRALSATEASELASNGNTSATWTGGTSSSWGVSSNWNIGAVPDAYTDVLVGNGTYQPTLAASTSLASLTINSGDSLNLGGQNLTMNDSGSFINNGTLILQGGETLTGISNDTSSGSIEFDGGGTYASLVFGNNYNNLLFNGSGTYELDSPLTVNKNLSITNATLSANGYNITTGGNWSNSGGNYFAVGNTVTLDGADQTISGSNTFYNLSKTTSSAATLTFGASSEQTIINSLTLTGAPGQLLQLNSSTSGTQWQLNPNSTNVIFNLNYLAVQDAYKLDNVGTDILNPTNSVDNGNNLNWFPPYKPTTLGPVSYVDGGYTSNPTPTLSFNLRDSDISINVRYEVQVAQNSSFINPVIDYTSGLVPQGSSSFTLGQNAGSGSYTSGFSGQTLSDGDYYWRVQMIDGSGISSGYESANNGSEAFRVDTTPPTIPGTPFTTTPTTSTTPLWTWTASTDSGSGLASAPYTVEWSTDPSFVSDVSSTTSQTNFLTLPTSLNPGTWYARVKAKDVLGNVSAYSSSGSVVIVSYSTSSSATTKSYPQSGSSTDSQTSSASQSSGTSSSNSSLGSSQEILLNNYAQYTSGEGKNLNLSSNQIVYFKVGSQLHSVTIDRVGPDYVVLTLKSTPRNVTIQTGDTDEYDVTGDGKPDIAITLRGTQNGVALLTFAVVKLPSVQVKLTNNQQGAKDSLMTYWIIILFVVIASFIIIVAYRKRRKSN